jgi:tetratricopeptide (TPR) repeat protein
MSGLKQGASGVFGPAHPVSFCVGCVFRRTGNAPKSIVRSSQRNAPYKAGTTHPHHSFGSDQTKKSQDLCYFVTMAWLTLGRPRRASLALVLATSLLSSGSIVQPSLAQGSAEKQIERYLQEAQAAEKKQDYDVAGTTYQNILKLRPQWALIHQSLGVVYHLQSRFPEAISSLEKAIKLDPALWGSHLFLGMGLYRTNQFLKAIPALEQSIKLNPKLAESEARLWLGSSYLALNRFEEALTQFRRLSEIKSGDLEALYNLAEVCNRYSSALFEKITVLDPESPEAHRLQAEWFEWQDKSDEAIGEYLQVLEVRPDWEDVSAEGGAGEGR